jgi:hypothetical protein
MVGDGRTNRLRGKAAIFRSPQWIPVFGKGLSLRKRGSCSTNKLKRDDGSKKSHHALGAKYRAADGLDLIYVNVGMELAFSKQTLRTIMPAG